MVTRFDALCAEDSPGSYVRGSVFSLEKTSARKAGAVVLSEMMKTTFLVTFPAKRNNISYQDQLRQGEPFKKSRP